MNKVENAVSLFRGGLSCSQAILSTYGETFGLDKKTAIKIAGAFGGGMAHMGETCGAVTGAFMVIGLRFGMNKPGDSEAKQKTYDVTMEFVKRFRDRRKSILCRELLGCEIGTPDGMQQATDKGLFTNLCPELVRDAAKILEELL
jgi:C_GCAxxG_C_C family probable redox protein